MLRQPLVRLVIAAALVVASMQATSGWFGMVTTRGISMEPTFRQGDLVFTKRSGGYGVGDIIAYRSAELADEVVLHRVIEVDGEHYVTQGDNNDFVDKDRPTEADVVGVAWWHVPGAGRYLAPVRNLGPYLAAAVAGLCFLVALSKRRQHADHEHRRGARRRRPSMPALPSSLTANLTPARLAAAAAAFAVVAAVGLSRPAETRSTTTTTFDHAATFDYAAPAAANLVYADGSVDVGDPIFRASVHALTIGVDYHLDGSDDAEGAVALRTVLRVGTWEHVLAEEEPVPVEDGAGRATTRLDFDAVDEVVRRFATESGQSTPGASIVVGASVDVAGTVDGVRFTSGFAPELVVPVNPTEVLIDDEQLEQVEAGSIETAVAVPASIDVLGRDLPVGWARRVGVLGTLVLGLLVLFRLLRARPGRGARILEPVPDDPRMVHVTSFEPSAKRVEVSDFETLQRIAEEYDRFILCITDEIGRRSYAVEDGGTTFQTVPTWVP